MRFLTRSLAGILILGLTLGLLALAVNNIRLGLEARNAEAGRERPAEERVFAVNVATLTPGPAQPVITGFGEVESARSLEIRAESPGRIVALSDAFRDGGQVAAGDILVQIDPADAESALDLARAELAEAEAELSEAQADLTLAEDDLAAAERQLELRAQALARQEDLLGRGAGTSAAVETAALALSSAEQALVGRRQALAAGGRADRPGSDRRDPARNIRARGGADAGRDHDCRAVCGGAVGNVGVAGLAGGGEREIGHADRR